jgi:hypothetical protein
MLEVLWWQTGMYIARTNFQTDVVQLQSGRVAAWAKLARCVSKQNNSHVRNVFSSEKHHMYYIASVRLTND